LGWACPHYEQASCLQLEDALFGQLHGVQQRAPAAHETRLANYFERLCTRPSFVRVLDEARPFFPLFPLHDAIPSRFLTPGPG
jgi:hypothetical protein